MTFTIPEFWLGFCPRFCGRTSRPDWHWLLSSQRKETTRKEGEVNMVAPARTNFRFVDAQPPRREPDHEFEVYSRQQIAEILEKIGRDIQEDFPPGITDNPLSNIMVNANHILTDIAAAFGLCTMDHDGPGACALE